MKTKIIAMTLLGSSLALSGCASTDGDTTEAEATATGAVAGALIGLLVGDNKKGALIGAALGTVLGNMYGKHVAEKKAEYANNEEYMNDVIAEADLVLTAAKEQKARLETVIAERETELAKLDKQEAHAAQANEESQAELAKLQEETDKLLARIEKEITIQTETLENERNAIPAVLVSRSDANITALGSEQRQLQLLKARLASVDTKRVR